MALKKAPLQESLFLCGSRSKGRWTELNTDVTECKALDGSPSSDRTTSVTASPSFYSWWSPAHWARQEASFWSVCLYYCDWYGMEEWTYVDDRELTNCCCQRICITCEFFTHGVDAHCRTLVACRIREQQLQQGEHLTKVCKLWSPTWQSTQGWTWWTLNPLPNPLPINV